MKVLLYLPEKCNTHTPKGMITECSILLYLPEKCNTHTPIYDVSNGIPTLYLPEKCNTHTPHVTYTTETQRVTLHFAIPKSLLAVA